VHEAKGKYDPEVQSSVVAAKDETVIVIRQESHAGALHPPSLPREGAREPEMPCQRRPSAPRADYRRDEKPPDNEKEREDDGVLVNPSVHGSELESFF
jgi:hypothetical protein